LSFRNRIKCHRRVKACDLVPHELNFRLHPDQQKAALKALYEEVGFARSLLAFELPDGRLKLIDGHLRRDLDSNMEVEVEVLDVTEEEARKLLLSIDPLATLAETQTQLHQRLLNITPTPCAELQAAWQKAAESARAALAKFGATAPPPIHFRSQFLVLITCQDEKHQVDLLKRFQDENLNCRALVS
jgi:hypothetical protein